MEGSCFTCHSTDKCYDSTGGGGSKECAICCPGGDNTGLVTTDPKWNITGTAQNSTTYCMPPALYSLPMSQGNQAHDTEYTCQNALFYPKDCTGGGGCTNPTTGPATDSNLTKNWWWCDAGAVVNQNRSDIPLTRLLAPRAIGGGPGQEGNPCGYGCMKCIKSGKMCGFIDAPLQFVSLTVENYPNSNTQNISLGGKVTAIYKVPANRNVKSKYPVGEHYDQAVPGFTPLNKKLTEPAYLILKGVICTIPTESIISVQWSGISTSKILPTDTTAESTWVYDQGTGGGASNLISKGKEADGKTYYTNIYGLCGMPPQSIDTDLNQWGGYLYGIESKFYVVKKKRFNHWNMCISAYKSIIFKFGGGGI